MNPVECRDWTMLLGMALIEALTAGAMVAGILWFDSPISFGIGIAIGGIAVAAFSTIKAR